MMRVSSVEEAVQHLSEVTRQAARANHRWGYFAALYSRVTRAVGERIADGYFDDGERMSRLDVAFANRYFDALDAHLSGRGAMSEAWRVAFAACEERDAAVLQHLYLGLNAHLLLDLGIAAAETCPGRQLRPARDDFHRINYIVSGLMTPFHRDLGWASPSLGRLDGHVGWLSTRGSMSTLRWIRGRAWSVAEEVNSAAGEQRSAIIAQTDRHATQVGRFIIGAARMTKPLWDRARRQETASVRDIIRILASDQTL